MTLNSYLTKLATLALIRHEEKDNIRRSIDTLKSRLNDFFSDQLSNQFIFGSYARETILPRHMDTNSDVDYIVVFKDNSNDPQTYLNRLRDFARSRYCSSEVFQSRPTMVLSLGHIKFDLVPAIPSILGLSGFRIPAKASEYKKWIHTDPNELNRIVTEANKSSNFLIKPLIRIIKYWNANNDYPFESFDLEKKIVQHNFIPGNLLGYQLQDYLIEFFEKLNPSSLNINKGEKAILRAKKIIAEIKSIETIRKRSPLLYALASLRNPHAAEDKIKKLLPIPLSTLSSQLHSL